MFKEFPDERDDRQTAYVGLLTGEGSELEYEGYRRQSCRETDLQPIIFKLPMALRSQPGVYHSLSFTWCATIQVAVWRTPNGGSPVSVIFQRLCAGGDALCIQPTP